MSVLQGQKAAYVDECHDDVDDVDDECHHACHDDVDDVDNADECHDDMRVLWTQAARGASWNAVTPASQQTFAQMRESMIVNLQMLMSLCCCPRRGASCNETKDDSEADSVLIDKMG